MFSKELEEIIDAALADGVLTDKERSVLHKRAQAEGVDSDELDVVIDGRLAKIKKQEDWLRPTPPHNLPNEKKGNVIKCPNCGCTDISGRAVCPDCGYVFTNVKANQSAERLAEQLATVEKERRKDLVGDMSSLFGISGGKVAEKVSIIKNFPVPNTRDDLLEFLSMLKPKSSKYGKPSSDSPIDKLESKAYYIKFAECVDKARLSFDKDPAFQPYFEFYKKEEKRLSPLTKALIVLLIFYLFMAILFVFLLNH